MKTKLLVILVVIAGLFTGYLAVTAVDEHAPAAIAVGKTYSGMVYVAGMGGHFAKADVTIDPSNEGSSAESVDGFRFRQIAKCMI